MARKLAPVRLVVCGSPDYLAEQGVPGSPVDCSSSSRTTRSSQWAFTLCTLTGNICPARFGRSSNFSPTISAPHRIGNVADSEISAAANFFGRATGQTGSVVRFLQFQTETPERLNGNSRIRVPVAAKIALVIAGVAAANGGSPRPVGELSLWMKWHSTSGA